MKIKETFLTIDPPSGWKYGFPKIVTQEQYKSIKNLKQWCIDNGYPKAEADSYGDYFHIQINGDLSFTLMNEKPLTRELAADWFASKSYLEQHSLSDKYFESRHPSLLTIEQVEEIYNKEVLEPKRQKEWQESQVNYKYTKPNAKEFKQFDESLHKAYLNKFSEEDKFKAFISNLNELSKEIQFNAFLATLKKMKLDSQTQSNIMTLVALKDI